MLDKMNWASQKRVEETYTILQADKANPIVIALIREHNFANLFHKVDNKVVPGPYIRTCVLPVDVNTILQKLFLPAGFLSYSMGQVGCCLAYDDRGTKYELERGGRDTWIQVAGAKPVTEGEWFRRMGTCKNYAPKISPLPFNVFKGEDQHIYLSPEGVLNVFCISAAIFNGTNLRTVRHFEIAPDQATPTSSHVTMRYGGLFTDISDPAQIAAQAEGVRAQTFAECTSTNPLASSSGACSTFLWEEHANNYLRAC